MTTTRRPRLEFTALALSLLTFAPACTSLTLEVGAPVDAARIEALEPGLADRTEVLAALGPPSALAVHGEGFAFLYAHIALEEVQLGLSLDLIGTLFGTAWLGLFKVALGNSEAGRRAAFVLFDREGRVTSRVSGDWEELFGEGGSLQVIFAVQQVVDADDLRRSPSNLTWGRWLLDPLPRTLNLGSVPDLELRGTPRDVGQRALERRVDVGGKP